MCILQTLNFKDGGMSLFCEVFSLMPVSDWALLATRKGVALGWDKDTSVPMRSLILNPEGKVCRRVKLGRNSCLRQKISPLQAHQILLKVCKSCWIFVMQDLLALACVCIANYPCVLCSSMVKKGKSIHLFKRFKSKVCSIQGKTALGFPIVIPQGFMMWTS